MSAARARRADVVSQTRAAGDGRDGGKKLSSGPPGVRCRRRMLAELGRRGRLSSARARAIPQGLRGVAHETRGPGHVGGKEEEHRESPRGVALEARSKPPIQRSCQPPEESELVTLYHVVVKVASFRPAASPVLARCQPGLGCRRQAAGCTIPRRRSGGSIVRKTPPPGVPLSAFVSVPGPAASLIRLRWRSKRWVSLVQGSFRGSAPGGRKFAPDPSRRITGRSSSAAVRGPGRFRTVEKLTKPRRIGPD